MPLRVSPASRIGDTVGPMSRDYPRPVPVGKYRRNEAFWRFARRMLRQRRTIVIAAIMAVVSATNMGVGLVGMVPVLNNILEDGDQSTLPRLAERFNEQLSGVVVIPQAWIDQLPDGRYDAVVSVISVLGLLTIIGAFANFAHLYYAFTLSTRTVADVRRTAYHHLVRLPLTTMVQGKSNDLVSRVVQDTAVLNNGFNALTGKAIAQSTKGAASLGAAFFISWKLSLVTCAIGPIVYIIIRKLGKRIRRASRGAMRGRARLLGAATEVVRGYRVVKVYTTERQELGRFTRINNDVLREQLRERTAKALASPLIEAVTIFILGILALIAMKWIIDGGSLDASDFIMTLGALGLAGNALKPLSSIVQDIQKADSAAQRIAEIIDMPSEETRTNRLPRLPRHAESIVFRDVTYTYPTANEPALRHLDLEIEHGMTVAVVGPNGSGKTTLLGLVPNLYQPDSGQVLIDGQDLQGVSLRSLRRQIAVVTQETVLFQGTIGENIAYGTPDATQEQIEAAAARAHATEFINLQPQGFDTPVGDQGLALSGGQRQRVAIARAILRDPAILIMDEATSMIDSDSEARISDAISQFGEGRTCLIVAHRLSTVINADRIVVLDRGTYVDSGTHDELLSRCGVYQQIARHQLAPPSTSDEPTDEASVPSGG